MVKKPSRPKKTKRGDLGLPPVTIVEVIDVDAEGDLKARPTNWTNDGPPPQIVMITDRRRGPALGRGDRVLARISVASDGLYEARPIRKLDGGPAHVLGVYEVGSEGGRLKPTSKKAKKDFVLEKKHSGGADPGELVRAEVLPARRRHRLGLRAVRVTERLGPVDDPRGFSLIAIHEHDIPLAFPDSVTREAQAMGPAKLGKRADFRKLPLVTIDGEDARDFDDAVFAEADSDAKNPSGWHLVVAIADVAHYVRPGSAIDQEAERRGNSVYFPDRVVPMLPEALSNNWCSLRPDEDRAVLAADLWLDSKGNLIKHRFRRGLMRSCARLTYEWVEERHRALVTGKAEPGELDDRIEALYGAYGALAQARDARGTLDLDLPERKVVLGSDGTVQAIAVQPRFDSHRLIEEFMIAANVAAAEELERLREPCMYRVHEPPDPAKLEALRQTLESLDLHLPKAQVIRPKTLNTMLGNVKDRPEALMVNEMILRSQSQAVYAPRNLGHFGLALRRYAHFTSPIRRYADLLVHRALIKALSLGPGGWESPDPAELDRLGEAISQYERRAIAAERSVVDRFTAAFLAERVGEAFQARVSGLTRAGLFVELQDIGADGLIPLSFLEDDRYDYDPTRQILEGRRWGRVFRLGMAIAVRLIEATPVTGGLIFAPVAPSDAPEDSPSSNGVKGGWDPLKARKGKKVRGRSDKRRRKT